MDAADAIGAATQRVRAAGHREPCFFGLEAAAPAVEETVYASSVASSPIGPHNSILFEIHIRHVLSCLIIDLFYAF